jgi:1-aminocyclopropane-1-carboxylate deaminase/D-cysteine desulfhydrase-like pyridoxal-dependent ACC family enzyme
VKASSPVELLKAKKEECLMERLPLFEVYPKLKGMVPWKPIGNFPTPVRKLESLGEHTGISEFYLKNDSQSSALYGGNKVRKLEFLLADALEKEASTVITVGAAGSNHVLATSIFAKKFGMKAVGILFDQPPAAYVRRNLLLNLYFNTEIFYASSMRGVPSILREVLSKVQGKPYLYSSWRKQQAWLFRLRERRP